MFVVSLDNYKINKKCAKVHYIFLKLNAKVYKNRKKYNFIRMRKYAICIYFVNLCLQVHVHYIIKVIELFMENSNITKTCPFKLILMLW